MQNTGQPEATANPSTSPTDSRISDTPNSTLRPERPCDACRRRKSRCVLNGDAPSCTLCTFHRQPCTFQDDPTPRKRKPPAANDAPNRKRQCVPPALYIRMADYFSDYQNQEFVVTQRILYGLEQSLMIMPTSKVLLCSRRRSGKAITLDIAGIKLIKI